MEFKEIIFTSQSNVFRSDIIEAFNIKAWYNQPKMVSPFRVVFNMSELLITFTDFQQSAN